MEILHTIRKSPNLNTIEKFYIHEEPVNNNPLTGQRTKYSLSSSKLYFIIQPHKVALNHQSPIYGPPCCVMWPMAMLANYKSNNKEHNNLGS
jgi:hypothetical protein